MESITPLLEKYAEELREFVSNCLEVGPKELGLDQRAAWKVFLCDDAIIVKKQDNRTMLYYGGFEYIEPEYVIPGEEFVVYQSEASRVADCIDFYNDNKDK